VQFCASSITTKALFRAPAHVAHWCDLDGALGDQRPHPLHRQPVRKGVVERPQVGRELVLHVARQEADGFTGLHRRPGEHDLAHGPGLQGLDRLGDGEVRLAGAGRSKRHHQVLLVDRFHQPGLAVGLGADGLEVALLAPIHGASERRPVPIQRQATDLSTVVILGGWMLDVARGTPQGALGHSGLRWDKKKGRDRCGPPFGEVRGGE